VANESVRGWLRGPAVALTTPFHDDFTLDLEGLRSNIEALVSRGIRLGDGVLVVAAAAGEFATMSRDERVAVMRASVAAADGRVPVMSSIQHTDWREILALARAAEDAGVAGLQVAPTYYYASTEDDFLQLLDLVAGATSLPLMVYNTWWEGGFAMGPDFLRRVAEHPGVGALKWSAPTYEDYTAGLAAVADRLAVIDNQRTHAWGHILGATGFVTHVGNFWPEYPLEIWRAMEAHDYRGVPRILDRFEWPWGRWIDAVAERTGGEGPFLKAAMRLVGMAGGPPRPPASQVPAELVGELQALLARAGGPRPMVTAPG